MNVTQPLHVAVFGCCATGHFFAHELLQRHQGTVRLVAVGDPLAKRCDDFCKEFHLPESVPRFVDTATMALALVSPSGEEAIGLDAVLLVLSSIFGTSHGQEESKAQSQNLVAEMLIPFVVREVPVWVVAPDYLIIQGATGGKNYQSFSTETLWENVRRLSVACSAVLSCCEPRSRLPFLSSVVPAAFDRNSQWFHFHPKMISLKRQIEQQKQERKTSIVSFQMEPETQSVANILLLCLQCFWLLGDTVDVVASWNNSSCLMRVWLSVSPTTLTAPERLPGVIALPVMEQQDRPDTNKKIVAMAIGQWVSAVQTHRELPGVSVKEILRASQLLEVLLNHRSCGTLNFRFPKTSSM